MLIIIPIIIANVHSAVWPFYFILYLPYIAEQLIYAIITVDYKYLYKRVHLFFRRKKLNQSEIEKEKLDLQEEKKAHKLKIEKNLGNLYKFRINKEKNIKWLILIMVICAFTGLLTPIKDTPYTYLIKTNQGNTTQNISEHLPLTLIKNNNMMVILTIVLGILIFSKTKIKVRDFFMLAGLILLSFMSQRQVSMLVLICNFIVLKLICELIESVRKNDLKTKNSDIQYIVMFAVFCAIVMCNIALSLKECKIEKNGPFISASSYPIEACNFIENDLIPSVGIENIRFYNEYNYGSYLLYRGIPVFIDSRADLYTPEFNGKKGKDGKYVGRDIFTDFLNISSLASSYESEFEKYKITHVITYSNSKLNSIIAKDGNYKELYDDGSFTIYERLSAQITIDQIFKYYILINKENLPNNIINGVLNFTYCENRGIAFGIGQGGAKIFALMTLLMIIVALIYIAFKFNKLKGLTVFGIALVISGGIGNLIDRLFRGYVIDYIDFSEIVDFPIFNFADICIVVGVIIIGISYLKNEGGEVNERINS